jgi:alkanesulfonate monooxygenase SsuD/methylene tetrahydromethanopterin reductase-like flavin-dependent oxidoreductase (luciferase family)
LEVWGDDYEQLLITARAAEQFGFAALYYGESPHRLNLETSTVCAALAAHTTTLRLGSVITNLLPTYRSFPLFVRQVEALTVISRGRFDLRTATGAAQQWARPWWDGAGVTYPDRAARRHILDDWLHRLREDWAGSVPASIPASVPPPITVAATGPDAMTIAARHADMWEASFCTVTQFRELAARFDALAAHRQPRVLRSLEIDAVTAPTASARHLLTERFLAERGPDGPTALAKALTGSAAEIAERLSAYHDAGADQLLVATVDPHDQATLESLATAAALC